jgi:hypothetical protein
MRWNDWSRSSECAIASDESKKMTHLGTHFERAITYALHVHGGHVRKGTNVPYFSYCEIASNRDPTISWR